jgi:CrcB protein
MGDYWLSFIYFFISYFKKIKHFMKQFLLVFFGGGLGSVFRYLISKIPLFNFSKFPIPTLFSNIIGCFILGIVLGYAIKNDHLNSPQTLLLATGFCGGLTTFSAFAYENLAFIKSGEITQVFFYTLISLILGFSAIFIGLQLSK